MSVSIRRIKIIAMIAIALAMAIVLLASPPAVVLGITSEVAPKGLPPPVYDYTIVPYEIATDAFCLAEDLFGKNTEAKNNFVSQLLGTYLAAKDNDLIIVFNPGGWGWRFLDESPNWYSIFMGLQEEAKESGYRTLLLEYRRSINTLKSNIDEYMAITGLYPQKAITLASRLEFLTGHIPNLKIILTGESNGTIICDEAMEILKDNPQVYSIQTGTPFWHKNTKNERILVINNNGLQPDSFSNGDFFTLISKNIEIFLGFSPPQPKVGTVLNIFTAPGHTYSWQNPVVRRQIEEFLNRNLPPKDADND
ncbi:MAG: hypothetical protein ABIB93_01325 [Chloroflexota bacterium]